MDYKSYEWRIALSLVMLLILIQVAGFIAVQRSNRAIAMSVVENELRTASLVVLRVINLRHQQLVQSASVLASDFGLRETLSDGDLQTIESMLHNHGKRIGAALVLVSEMDGQILAGAAPGLQAPMPDVERLHLKDQPEKMNITSVPHAGGHSAFQVVTVPVLPPTPTARLSKGVAIDDNFLKDLGELNDLEVSVLKRDAEDRSHVVRSTFSEHHHESLINELPTEWEEEMWRGSLGDEEFQILALPLADTERPDMHLLLGVSLNRKMAPFKRIEAVAGALIFVGLLLSGLAVFMVTRRMVAPLNAMANLDALTGLANRQLLNRALNRAEVSRQHSSISYSLLMMDLNKFKVLNDTFGHAAGDKVLQTVAARLRTCVRDTDTICRQGGDEFVILLAGADKQSAERVAKVIVHKIAMPIDFDGHALEVGASIGIAVAKPGPSLQMKAFLEQADEAMYAAKRGGGGFVTADT
jgi:diguanylate cyclase (GGDEF)-like protein